MIHDKNVVFLLSVPYKYSYILGLVISLTAQIMLLGTDLVSSQFLNCMGIILTLLMQAYLAIKLVHVHRGHKILNSGLRVPNTKDEFYQITKDGKYLAVTIVKIEMDTVNKTV